MVLLGFHRHHRTPHVNVQSTFIARFTSIDVFISVTICDYNLQTHFPIALLVLALPCTNYLVFNYIICMWNVLGVSFQLFLIYLEFEFLLYDKKAILYRVCRLPFFMLDGRQDFGQSVRHFGVRTYNYLR